MLIPILFAVLILSPLMIDVFAQEVITVNQTEPCFLNYSAGVDMWKNCGFDEDLEDEEGFEFEDDGQPSEYTEWQDFNGGDDWDQGQYDEFM